MLKSDCTRAARRAALTAFTLIELLVAIAIIGLLLAILLPSLSASKRKTLSLVCETNLRILAEAIDQYVQINDGWYPDTDPFPLAPWISPDINLHNSCLPHRIHRVKLTWDDPTRIYSAWYCPVKGAIPEPLGLRAQGHGTYAYNSRDLSKHNVNGRVQGRHQSRRTRTSEIGLLRDLVALDRLALYPNDSQKQAWYDYAHDNGQNIVFLDEHVERSTDRRWMLWAGAGNGSWMETGPEFPRWFTGTDPPLPDF